jgi:hypothetical protein
VSEDAKADFASDVGGICVFKARGSSHHNHCAGADIL